LIACLFVGDGCAGPSTSSFQLWHAKSRPIVDALKPWLLGLGLISQKTKLAEAIRYALSR
jgi:hypothetical protein